MKTKTALFGHYHVALRFYLDHYGSLAYLQDAHKAAQSEAHSVRQELATAGHQSTLTEPRIDANPHGIYWHVAVQPDDRTNAQAFHALDAITKAHGFKRGK